MKTYSFALIRYIPDLVAAEFANVGVVLYCPQSGSLLFKVSTHVSRLTDFFGHFDKRGLRATLDGVEKGLRRLARDLEKHPLRAPRTAEDCIARVFPHDDSAVQFVTGGAGLTQDLDALLARLFTRYVERHADQANARRDDAQVLNAVRRPLSDRKLLSRMESKEIVGDLRVTHTFPLAYKNGLWHACDAVSFDLLEPQSILDKATKWLGRGTLLRASREPFKAHLIVAPPSAPELKGAFDDGCAILDRMACPHEIVLESQLLGFVDEMDRLMHEEHGKHAPS
jgi:hypothetical protein